MKKRILFVDDEPMLLQGLQRMLRSMREEWEMVFVDGGEQALAAMEACPFDVVVTDMRMPIMNGAELLNEVRGMYPLTVRLVLSGHADKDLVSQCLGVAHQYISKPCDPEQLKGMIRNACLIGSGGLTEKIKQVLGTLDRLPSMPQVYVQLEQALANEHSSAQQFGDIIIQDMAMTAKILKIVNSAFFGLRRAISSPHEAVTYLGLDTVRALILANSIFEKADPLLTRSFALDDLWTHSMAVATAAKAIAKAEGASQEICEAAFVGGILEDVGILVLAGNFPEAYDRAMASLLGQGATMEAAERGQFGVTHGEVGAYLLGLWGLPASVLDIISFHHQADRLGGPELTPALAVHAADILVGETGGHPMFRTAQFDPAVMARSAWAAKVEGWRALIQEPK